MPFIKYQKIKLGLFHKLPYNNRKWKKKRSKNKKRPLGISSKQVWRKSYIQGQVSLKRRRHLSLESCTTHMTYLVVEELLTLTALPLSSQTHAQPLSSSQTHPHSLMPLSHSLNLHFLSKLRPARESGTYGQPLSLSSNTSNPCLNLRF